MDKTVKKIEKQRVIKSKKYIFRAYNVKKLTSSALMANIRGLR